jgi:hypothetical protein
MRMMMRWTVPAAAGNAAVEFLPVMTAEDLKKAFAKLAS